MRLNSILRFMIFLSLVVAFTSTAQARRKKIHKHKHKKNGQLMKSINDAMDRSNEDQQKMKIIVDFEADERMDSWSERDNHVIEIKHTGASSIGSVDLGEADFSYEESGEDQSGLNGLTSPVEDESVDINFDEELREVSSIKKD